MPKYAQQLLDKENIDSKLKEAQDMEKYEGNKSKEIEIISPIENSKENTDVNIKYTTTSTNADNMETTMNKLPTSLTPNENSNKPYLILLDNDAHIYTDGNIGMPIVLDGTPVVQTTFEENITGLTLTDNPFEAFVKHYIKMRGDNSTLGLVLDNNKYNNRLLLIE